MSEGSPSPRDGGADWVRALAPAKVNLTLAVLGRRDDGYHELETSLLALDLCDEIAVRRLGPGEAGAGREVSPGLWFALGGPAAEGVPIDADNLVLRAARGTIERFRAGAREAGREQPSLEQLPLELELTKRIPGGAGLGGGSSDAAAALLAVAALLGAGGREGGGDKCDIDSFDLRGRWPLELLASLGSDCPFFFAARETGAGSCAGRGERVTPLPAPRCDGAVAVAVVAPAVPLATARVYAGLENSLSPPPRASRLPVSLDDLSVEAARGLLFNDLEVAALTIEPELRSWRDLLNAGGADQFRLAGSGSSFFGLFDSTEEAARVLEEVRNRARRRGLGLRGTWLTRPSGHGCKLI